MPKKQKQAPPIPKQQPIANPVNPTHQEVENRKAYIQKHEANRHVCQVCKQRFEKANQHRSQTCKAPLYRKDILCQRCQRWNTIEIYPTHKCTIATGAVINLVELDWTRHDQKGLPVPELGKIQGRSYCNLNCGKHFACRSSAKYHEQYIYDKGPKLLKPIAKNKQSDSSSSLIKKNDFPFKCEHCEDSCDKDTGLKNHKLRWCKVLHPKDMINCPHANYNFQTTSKQSLTYHNKIAHKSVDNQKII